MTVLSIIRDSPFLPLPTYFSTTSDHLGNGCYFQSKLFPVDVETEQKKSNLFLGKIFPLSTDQSNEILLKQGNVTTSKNNFLIREAAEVISHRFKFTFVHSGLCTVKKTLSLTQPPMNEAGIDSEDKAEHIFGSVESVNGI